MGTPPLGIGGLPEPVRREVIRAKDGWHVMEWFSNGIHPDYRSISGPFRSKSEAEKAREDS